MVVESDRLITTEIVKRLNQVDTRLRELEQWVSKSEYSAQGLESMLSENQKIMEEKLDAMKKDMADAAASIEEFKTEFSALKKNLENTVKKEEFKEILHYVNLMNPIFSHYMTKEEVRRMIDELKVKQI